MLARPDLDEAGKILVMAADHVERYGWCQLGLAAPGIGNNNERCALMAIWAQGNNNDAVDAANRLARYLGFTERKQVVHWNDTPERTKEEVISALREAAYFRD